MTALKRRHSAGSVRTGDKDEERPDRDEIDGEFVTATLAEIYYEQGQLDRAMETYQEIVMKNPDDASSEKRLEELLKEKRATMSRQRLTTVLEDWLQRIREFGNA